MMRNNDDMKNELTSQHVETHPREEHRRKLRRQMLAAFQCEERESIPFPRPFLRRWAERAALLAAGVVLGMGIGVYLRAKPPIGTETISATKPPVILVLEYDSPPPTDKADFWTDKKLVEKYLAKTKPDSQSTSRFLRREKPWRLSDLIGELQ
jgi:hypothetical protein